MEVLYRELELKRLECRIVTAEVGNGEPKSGIRFCFHHYHSDDDVRDLAEFIGDFRAKGDGATPDHNSEPIVIQHPFEQSA